MAILEKIEELKNKIEILNQELNECEKNLKEDFINSFGLVDGLFEYLKYKGYPLEIYSSFGMDSGEYDYFGKVQLKIVYTYGYTDVVGLTNEEFRLLSEKINEWLA